MPNDKGILFIRPGPALALQCKKPSDFYHDFPFQYMFQMAKDHLAHSMGIKPLAYLSC